MRLALPLAVLFLTFACGHDGASDVTATPDGAPVARAFGVAPAAGEVLAVSTLLASPDAYVGKTVRVRGIAVAVCPSRGCWFDVASDVEGQTLRIKVEDGVMVFPADLVGETVLAEGVFTANTLDLETTKMVCAKEAASEGKPFDANAVTDCMTLYQLSGTGALQLARAE